MARIITNTKPPRRADVRGIGWARAAVVAGALVYAAFAIGNGLDRLAFARPGLTRYLPAVFATNALEVAAQADLGRDPHAAVAMAERLVARAPIEPASTALLGGGRAAIGDDAGADRAFRVAGQLGWRIPLTQSYLMAAALEGGDMPVAAQRLDALLRLQPQLLNDSAVLAPFEADAAAQGAFVDRLATRPSWLTWYIAPASAAVLARRVPAMILLGDRGIILGCAAIAPAVQMLTNAGLTAPAAALRQRHCDKR